MNSKRRFSTFAMALLVVFLLVMIALGFLLGPAHPLPWILIAVLVAIPYIHNRVVSRRFVTWKDDYSVGIERLDADHKRLMNLINRLQTAADYDTGSGFVDEALDELVDYTKNHFAREEELMEKYEYPDFEEHKRQHRKMVEKVDGMLDHYKEDPDTTVDELVQFLKNWLINHIAGTDQQYSGFLRDKGVS